MKYLPSYLVEQRKLDMEDRVLDLREQAFLHRHVAPTDLRAGDRSSRAGRSGCKGIHR